jgi:serine/threonine protein kinase
MGQDGLIEFGGTKRFAIQRMLGAGGMGVVYEALDREKQAQVALKTLRATNPEAILRLKREFRALQDIQHRNLVSLGELIEADGTWFFTMELVHGSTLLEYLRPGTVHLDVSSSSARHDTAPTDLMLHDAVARRRRPAPPSSPSFDEERLRDAMAQLTRGLMALHSAGKIHRDVKPSNVLVEPGGRVVLLDFGLVTDNDSGGSGLTDAHVVGTAAYMAPEQSLGKPVGPEADWYAVGVVLFEAMVGELPFDGPNLQVLMAKQQRVAVRASVLVPGVPRDLDELCAQLLEVDPASRPSGQAVLRALGANMTPSVMGLKPLARASSNTTTQPPFVGRQQELGYLQTALDDVRSGRQVTVFVHGESGIGKSSLLRHFSEISAGDRAVVLTGRCHEREAVPYKAMDGVIDALARYMQRLPKHEAAALLPRRASVLLQAFPVLKRVDVLADSPRHEVVDPQELRVRVFVALRELFGRLADRKPLICVIDDLQWADADGLALLSELIRPPDAPPFLLLASWREMGEEVSGVRMRFEGLPGDARYVKLRRLGKDEACELAASLLRRAVDAGTVSQSTAANIAREAVGHPLFIDELVRDRVMSRPDPERSQTGGATIRLEEVLWKRIQRLDLDASRVLEVVAVAGAPIDQESAARAAGMDLAAFGRHVAVLRVINLVRTTGTRGNDMVEPYHDRVRTSVLAHLPPAVLRERHRDLARALDASGRADPDALVEHYRGAGDPERAGRCAAAGADSAARALAFDQAARLYGLALRLLPESDSHRASLRVALAEALANAGHAADASRAYLACASGASAGQALDLRQRAAYQLLITGHFAEGIATVRGVLAEEGLAYPETRREAVMTMLLNRALVRLRGLRFRERDESLVPRKELMRLDACFQVGFCLSVADPIRSQAFISRGLLLALQIGEPYRLARALALEGGSYASMGLPGLRRGEMLFEAAERLALTVSNPHALAMVALARGQAAFLNGRFREACERCAVAEVELRERCIGAHFEVSVSQLWRCRALAYQGDYPLLTKRIAEFLIDVGHRGSQYATFSFQLTAAANLYLAADDVQRVRVDVAEAQRRWSPDGAYVQSYYAQVALLSADLYQGRPDLAYAVLREELPRMKRAHLMRVQFIRVVLTDLHGRTALARAQRTSGSERVELLVEAERDARRLEREKVAWAQPLAALLRGGLATLRGHTEVARAAFVSALTGFEGADMAMHVATAKLCLGKTVEGEEGRRLVGEGIASLEQRHVRRPEQFAAMLAPVPLRM